MRKSEILPLAGELQFAVNRLSEILVPVDLFGNAVGTARDELRAATAARNEIKIEFAVVCRRHSSNPEAPAVTSARSAFDRAEARCKTATVAFKAAREKQDEAFLRSVLPQIKETAPTLLEVVRLLNDSIAPLANLYGYAFDRGLPMPRLLQMTPTLTECTRAMTAIVNAVTEPQRKEDEE